MENLKLDEIVTPINVPVFGQLLKQANYQEQESQFLMGDFEMDLPLDIKGPQIELILQETFCLQ